MGPIKPATPCSLEKKGSGQNDFAKEIATWSVLNMHVAIMLSTLEMLNQPNQSSTQSRNNCVAGGGRSLNKNIQTYSYLYEVTFTIMMMVFVSQ